MSYPKEQERKTAKNWREYLEETKDMKEMFSWVWREFISPTGKRYAKIMFAFMVVINVLYILGPLSIKMVTDGLSQRIGSTVLYGVIFFAGLNVLEAIVAYFLMIYREYLLGENGRTLNQKASKLFFDKSLGQHTNENNLLNESNVRKGYERIQNIECMMLFEGLESLLSLSMPFIALWFLDIRFAGAISILLMIHIIWSLSTNRVIIREGMPLDKKWRYLYRYRTERWNHVEQVKNSSKEDEELEELDRVHMDVLTPDRRLWCWFIKQISMRGLVNIIALSGTLAYAAYLVWNGHETLGWLITVIMWTRQLFNNLWRIGHLEHRINEATPSVMSMKKALSMPNEIKVKENPIILKPDTPCLIEFKDVSHAYEETIGKSGKKRIMPVLRNISFTIDPGEKVALIGESGCGKSTIMKLLLRYFDPKFGNIIWDGHDMKDIHHPSLLDLIGYMSQETTIWSGDLEYNLTYDLPIKQRKLVNKESIMQVMKKLQCDFGERMVEGLQTRVGHRGVKLSGGQRQRVGLNRAAMKKPRLLVIDEATSSLDARTERLVQEGLDDYLKDNGRVGALIVTHRLNTVRKCNKLVMLTNTNGSGSTIEAVASSFEELAMKSANFRALAHDQGIILEGQNKQYGHAGVLRVCKCKPTS